MSIKIPFPEVKLRLKPDLKRQVEEAAKRNDRPITVEIISRLVWSFEAENVSQDAVAKALKITSDRDLTETRLAELEARVSALENKYGR